MRKSIVCLVGAIIVAGGLIASARGPDSPSPVQGSEGNGCDTSLLHIATLGTIADFSVTLGTSNTPGDKCPGPLVYISNTDSNDVWVVDMASASVVAVIPVGDDPRGIDISPDNSRVYVANRFDNTVSVIDTAINALVQTLDLGASPLVTAVEPYDVVVSTDGTRLYVAMKNGGEENGDGTVVFIDLPAGDIVTEVLLDSFASPEGTVVTPDGQKVYVAGRDDMYVVDVATQTFLGTSGSAGREVVASPDGAWVYADNNAVRTSDDAVFDTGEFSGERGIATAPDGLSLYSTNETNFVKVVQVDLSGGTPVTTFLTNIQDNTQSESYGLDLTDQGDRGVVSFRSSDTVRIFDAVNHTFIGPVIPMEFDTEKGTIFGSEPKQLVIAHTIDCNTNGVPDECDINDGTSPDRNSNGIPDECEPECSGPEECDDKVACTVDECKKGACVHTPDDTLCDDGEACTTDQCADGACLNTPLECPDGEICEDGECVPQAECNSPEDCDDGDACTTDECVAGECVNTEIECPQGEFCVDGQCQPDEDPCAPGPDGKVTICHIPPGNPGNAHTISVSQNAIPAHLAHGDHCGPCEDDDG